MPYAAGAVAGSLFSGFSATIASVVMSRPVAGKRSP